MAQQAMMGWVTDPSGKQVWGPTGAMTEYVPYNEAYLASNHVDTTGTDTTASYVEAQALAPVLAANFAAADGSYGGYTGLQAQAYVEQLAREYIEEARVAAKKATVTDPNALIALNTAIGTGQWNVLPALNPSGPLASTTLVSLRPSNIPSLPGVSGPIPPGPSLPTGVAGTRTIGALTMPSTPLAVLHADANDPTLSLGAETAAQLAEKKMIAYFIVGAIILYIAFKRHA